MVDRIPTPADFAASISALRDSRSPIGLDRELRLNFPSLVRSCEDIGLNIGAALGEWIRQESVESVAVWVDASTQDSMVAREWRRVRQNGSINALACLIQEQVMCGRGATLGAYLRSDKQALADELLHARRRSALAVIVHSRDVPFHRPVVLVRALDLAITYYKTLLFTDRQSGQSGLPSRTVTELGKAIVTRTRFAPSSPEDLELARELLLEAVELRGEKSNDYLSHYVEACIDLYHLNGMRDVLTDAVAVIRANQVDADDWPGWHLGTAEVWLALVSTADTETAARAFLSRAADSLSVVQEQELDLPDEIRARLLSAFVSFLSERVEELCGLALRGVRFPFGLRVATRPMPAVFLAASGYLIEALRSPAERGQYVYRDFLSELLSFVARRTPSASERHQLLREAVRLRGVVREKGELEGVRTVLANAADLLMLSWELALPGDRLAAILILVRAASADPRDPDPLVMLAREVELGGPAQINFDRLTARIAEFVVAGDSSSLYKIAAERAALSPDVRRRGIGGREGVVTVEDYHGFTGQSFVFKRMTRLCLSRDEDRAKEIAEAVEQDGLGHRFGVVEHLSTLEAVQSFDLRSDEIVSVRRFVNGRTLRRVLEREPETGRAALADAVDFLAYIHALPNTGHSASRRGLRASELGRWLRRLMTTEAADAMFTDWLSLVEGVPSLRRRDAHSLNWIVDDAARVLAVDLDATGVRPLGYELAQLTDDYPVFDPDDLDARLGLLDRYLDSLARSGTTVDRALAVRAFKAALAARAIGLVSDPDGNEQSRVHGMKLLAKLARDDSIVAPWARQASDAWGRKAGLRDIDRSREMSVPDRRRISRAMAFHLRHDSAAPTSRAGWIFADDLAELLNASGHSVSAEQLILVAGAHGEPRFELDGAEIRASYGHTTGIRIEYGERQAPRYLFHATPASSMASIFEARSGLSPMERQYVHLSEDLQLASRSAARFGQSVFELRIETARLEGLVFAAASTWLVKSVGVDAISILTPLASIDRTVAGAS